MFPNFIHVLLSHFNVPEQYFATARDHTQAKDNQPTSKALTATHTEIFIWTALMHHCLSERTISFVVVLENGIPSLYRRVCFLMTIRYTFLDRRNSSMEVITSLTNS